MAGKTISIVAAIVAFTCIPIRSAAQLTDAKALWERMVEAKGGRARLHAVHALVVSTNDPLSGFTRRDVAGRLQYEIVASFPDQFWWWSDYRPGKMGFDIAVWNRVSKKAWEALNGRSAGPSGWGPAREGDRRITLVQMAYLLETKYFQPTPVRIEQRVTARGTRMVLDATAPSMHLIRYVVDPASAMVEEIEATPLLRQLDGSGPETPASEPFYRYSFSGWSTVDGIQMPQLDGKTKLRFLINPDIDPKLFDTPPDNVTRADAWKKFLRK
jgi:hypothetical protein